METLTELEKRFQESQKEAEQSFKLRENIHEPTVEQRAQALSIIERLANLRDQLSTASEHAHEVQLIPENVSPSLISFLYDVDALLKECATGADQLRIRIENDRASEDLIHVVQVGRREDLATMIRSLDSVETKILTLIHTYEDEVARQAEHRKREADVLEVLRQVLKQYQK